MSWTYTFRLTDINEMLDLGREIRQSLSEEDDLVDYYTHEAFEAYNQLEPAPTVNTDIKDGCPSFVATLRHFVGAEYRYGLDTNLWSGWIGQSVPQILSDIPDGERLWDKLRGGQSGPYSLTVEGVEYRFDGGQFLFGSEIQRFGESLDMCREDLIRGCPEGSTVSFATRGEESEMISGEAFLSRLISQCVESDDNSLLWLY